MILALAGSGSLFCLYRWCVMAVPCGFKPGSTSIRCERHKPIFSLVIAATLFSPLLFAASSTSSNADLAKLLDKAQNGSLSAQVQLAKMYALGRTVEVNYVEAAHWYRKAADQGDPDSQTSLGIYYLLGRGVPKDETEAARWFQRAASSGFPLGQHNLGIMYLSGWGVAKDRDHGIDLLMRAATAGLAVSQFDIGLQYINGDLVPRDPELGVKWLKKAAHQGLPSANALLGIVYEKGQGTKADLPAAIKFYREAASQGSPIAQNNLARLYMEGHGIKKDPGEAMRLLTASAEQGNGQSYLNLALCSLKGCDSPIDSTSAYAWYLAARASGVEIPQPFQDTFAKLSAQLTESQIQKAQSDSQDWIGKHPAADPRSPVQLTRVPGVTTALNRGAATINNDDEVLKTLWQRTPFTQPRLPSRNFVY